MRRPHLPEAADQSTRRETDTSSGVIPKIVGTLTQTTWLILTSSVTRYADS